MAGIHRDPDGTFYFRVSQEEIEEVQRKINRRDSLSDFEISVARENGL